MNSPDLSDLEIDSICAGLKQNAAKVRYLRALGLRVDRKPNGRPLVARSEWERRNTPQPPSLASGASGIKWKLAA